MQLYLGALQRLSRDVDLIGSRRGLIEPVLDEITARYGRELFRWGEDTIADPPVDTQRFSVFSRAQRPELNRSP